MRKVLLIVGILGLLLSGLVLVISLALPMVTNGTSWDEAMWGIVPSCFCTFVSLVLAVVGLMMVMKHKKSQAGTSSTPGTPGTP